MTTHRAPCRTYLIYHSGLFAEGVRSILAKDLGPVQIVGMEHDGPRALKAVASLKPDVIIAEEFPENMRTGGLESLLRGARAGRVVRLSLDHAHATVYERHEVPATDPTDLIKAIRGARRQGIPGLVQTHDEAPKSTESGSGRTVDRDRSERKRRV